MGRRFLVTSSLTLWKSRFFVDVLSLSCLACITPRICFGDWLYFLLFFSGICNLVRLLFMSRDKLCDVMSFHLIYFTRRHSSSRGAFLCMTPWKGIPLPIRLLPFMKLLWKEFNCSYMNWPLRVLLLEMTSCSSMSYPTRNHVVTFQWKSYDASSKWKKASHADFIQVWQQNLFRIRSWRHWKAQVSEFYELRRVCCRSQK